MNSFRENEKCPSLPGDLKKVQDMVDLSLVAFSFPLMAPRALLGAEAQGYESLLAQIIAQKVPKGAGVKGWFGSN